MSREVRTSALMIFILSLALATSARALVYVVQKNDTLSQIAKKFYPGSVWAPRGGLKKIISDNPSVKNQNQIFIGQNIVIAEATSPVINRSVSAKLPEDQSDTAFEISPFLSMTTLNSSDSITGSHSTAASSVYAGLEGRFVQKWNDVFQTYLRGRLSYISFEPPKDVSKSLVEKSQFLTTFGVGATHQLSSRLRLGLSADLEKNLFLRGISTTSVTIDSVLVPSIGIQASYDLAQMSAFAIEATGVLENKFGAQTDLYSVKSGLLYGGRLLAKRVTHGEDQYEVSLAASLRSQGTSATDQTETTYTLAIRFFSQAGKP